MIQKIINDFLRSINYTNTSIHYDMNVIKIRLHENQSDQRYIYLYLHSPWRIIRNGKISNSSTLYPFEQEYDSEAEHK